MHFNVESLSKAKADVLLKILDDEKVDVLVIQETYTNDLYQIIPGYSSAGATYHNK